VRQLWLAREKVLVFCFYVETGRALRTHISRAVRQEVIDRGGEALGIPPADDDRVIAELDRLSDRLLRSDTSGYRLFRRRVIEAADRLEPGLREDLADIVIRFMRTPSFMVRFVDLSMDTTIDDLVVGFERPDDSGVSLAGKVENLAEALDRMVPTERDELIDALDGIQTGSIRSEAADFDPSERSRHRELLVPNVRLANGKVRQDTRRRLMLTFNTPFFPEVLVASSVMAEGVDLHRDCRHIIHHDLDWNPSTLEQRTGRLDRIGSKAALSEKPILIYEPFLDGTHDEKMFRVVKDREQWFGVVMGESTPLGERATEGRADRVPLAPGLVGALTMDLALAARR
jgi:hypothetical protein